jgi:hypothetical protein
MIHKELQTRIYPRGTVGSQRKWEWVVYDYDGFTPVADGEVIGSERAARSAASMAASRIYMERKFSDD